MSKDTAEIESLRDALIVSLIQGYLAKDKLIVAVKALEWYADESHWDMENCPSQGVPGHPDSFYDSYSGATEYDWIGDNGDTARDALKAIAE